MILGVCHQYYTNYLSNESATGEKKKKNTTLVFWPEKNHYHSRNRASPLKDKYFRFQCSVLKCTFPKDR